MSSEIRTLGEFLDIKHGFAFSGKHIVAHETNRILLTPGHFEIGGGFRHNHKKYYDSDVYKSGYELDPGEIIVSMTDLSKEGDTLGYSAIVPKIDGKILLHNQRIGRVVFKSDELDKGFCYYLLRDRIYRQHILATCTGSTVKHTSPTKILDFRFSLPEKSEQIAIAHILGALDDKIEMNRKMNQALEDIAKAIFKSWFTDFDPVRAKVEGRPTGLPAEINELFPGKLVDSDIGKIPAGWKVLPLDEIGTFKNGLALQKYPPLDGSEKLPVVKIAQLRKGSAVGDGVYASGVPETFVIDDGDFIFSWSGTLMAKYWVGGRGALNQHLFRVEGKNQPLWMVSGWVAQFMPEFQSIAASKATTMGHIKREHLRQALCIIPSPDVVDACSAIISPIIERGILALQECKVLNELRDNLLPKLISGELRIPDAERFLEEVGVQWR